MSYIAARFPIRLHTQNCCLFVSGIISLRQSGYSNVWCCYLQNWLPCCRLKELSMCPEHLWTTVSPFPLPGAAQLTFTCVPRLIQTLCHASAFLSMILWFFSQGLLLQLPKAFRKNGNQTWLESGPSPLYSIYQRLHGNTKNVGDEVTGDEVTIAILHINPLFVLGV